MVSLKRAAECIGRRIEHEKGIKLTGFVDRVDKHDVWVKTSDGDVVPCIPENMVWVSTLTPELLEAIDSEEHYETAQVFYEPFLFGSEADESMDYDESIPGISVVGSSAMANDDKTNHPLYVIARLIRQVYRVRMNASPDGAWEIEEYLGWAEA